MRLLICIASLLVAVSSQAQILGSNLEEDHQRLIEAEVAKTCQVKPFLLSQVSVEEEVVKIDQGIEDVFFTIVLSLQTRIDQGVFDQYEVLVKSVLSDHYDHNNKRWGAYSVESVLCKPVF